MKKKLSAFLSLAVLAGLVYFVYFTDSDDSASSITTTESSNSTDGTVFQRPAVKNLVVDNAGALTDWEEEELTAKLDSFEMATTTQIQIYTTTDLLGYAIADFGQRLGEGWGVGQAGFDNGIVIVYKPKTETENGQVTIQTGYGIEPLIPDAICKRIIENEMIPCFREDSVYQGFDRAVDVCISLTKGEFKADDYYDFGYSQKSSSGSSSSSSSSSYDELETRDYVVVFLVFVFMIVAVILSTRYANKNPGRVTRGHSGSSGGGRSGSYGGGHFGGGGASGSW